MPHPVESLYVVQCILCVQSRFSRVECNEAASFTTASSFVPQYVDLMHSAKFFEQRSEIVFVHVVRYLSYEHLYIVWIWLLHTIIVHYGVLLLIIVVTRVRCRRGLSLLFRIWMMMVYDVVVVMHVNLISVAVGGRTRRDFSRQGVQ